MQTLNGATLVPAYGRDYKSKAEVISAFESGKDFEIASVFHGGGYCSVSDFKPGDRVSLRYKRNTQVACHIVSPTLSSSL